MSCASPRALACEPLVPDGARRGGGGGRVPRRLLLLGLLRRAKDAPPAAMPLPMPPPAAPAPAPALPIAMPLPLHPPAAPALSTLPSTASPASTTLPSTASPATPALSPLSITHRRTSTAGSIRFAAPPLLSRAPSHDLPEPPALPLPPPPLLPATDTLRRSRSPPSALTNYSPRVGFDILHNKDLSGFTLRAKHADFKYSRRSRTFLVGTDQNDYSESAIDWLVEALAEDGDEIVILRVVDPGSKLAESIEAGGEPSYRRAARDILRSTMLRGDEDRAFDLVVEFHVGKVQDKLQEMIEIYHPDSLVVGSRGRDKGIQSLLPGSISKYCLQHSPVPVIVVRPDRQRQKKKKKRQRDPTRQSYIEILQNSIHGAETLLQIADDDGDIETVGERRVVHRMKSAPEISSLSDTTTNNVEI